MSLLGIGMNGEQLYIKIDAAQKGMALVGGSNGGNGIMKRRWNMVRVGCGTPAVPLELSLDPLFKP